MAQRAKVTTKAVRRKAESSEDRLLPPPAGAVIRMYRIGHGDCFLLAFPGQTNTKPVYVLIDCGCKPGSSMTPGRVKDVVLSIKEATGGHIDIAIVTHEHQDHVNGITKANFAGVTIGKTWLAWTEDPADDLANSLRRNFQDKLIGLMVAHNNLRAADKTDTANLVHTLAELEWGGNEDEPFAIPVGNVLGAAKPEDSHNKKSMKLFKDLAQDGVQFLRPHEGIVSLPGAQDCRVFVLGPPRDEKLLSSLDPMEDERFHLASSSVGGFFAAAATAEPGSLGACPFARRYTMPMTEAHTDSVDGAFFLTRYGLTGTQSPESEDEIPSNASWRRIDVDWLHSAEQLALDMNSQTNNSSLVLAFELGAGGPVLLFAADAQRGNWISWSKNSWQDGDKRITAKELLGRTVLYKVGHHGSHNATLHGLLDDDRPSLDWMAQGDYRGQFVAMITAVRAWAEGHAGWNHPLPANKNALLRKAQGRVFQTDTDLDAMKKPDDVSDAEWQKFRRRTLGTSLFFEYRVEA